MTVKFEKFTNFNKRSLSYEFTQYPIINSDILDS